MLASLASASTAWVLEADTDRDLRRAERAVRRADAERVVEMGPFTTCAELEAPSDRLARKVTRRLGRAPEERLDCDVAWFGQGRGWIAMVLEPPAAGLEQALPPLGYTEVARPSDPDLPVRLCVARGSLPEPLALARELEATGLGVRSVYEVGACRRYR
jgi:hypothetical protein